MIVVYDPEPREERDGMGRENSYSLGSDRKTMASLKAFPGEV
jgi:hypothetical protein